MLGCQSGRSSIIRFSPKLTTTVEASFSSRFSSLRKRLDTMYDSRSPFGWSGRFSRALVRWKVRLISATSVPTRISMSSISVALIKLSLSHSSASTNRIRAGDSEIIREKGSRVVVLMSCSVEDASMTSRIVPVISTGSGSSARQMSRYWRKTGRRPGRSLSAKLRLSSSVSSFLN